MSPVTHFFISWIAANSDDLTRREMAAVTLAGVVPDIDGLGIIADFLAKRLDMPLNWWAEYHHVLCHNLAFGVFIAGVAFFIGKRKWLTATLAFLTFHLHLLCDILGARGPEGEQWPILYLYPFSETFSLEWSGQWALNAWPNFVITAAALALTFYLAWDRGRSPLELISRKSDSIFVKTLRNRFPHEEAED